MILFLLSTGFQCGELSNLKWRDVDLVNQIATVYGKKIEQSSIPLVSKIIEEIAEFRLYCERKFNAKFEFVFPTQDNKRMTSNAIKCVFKRLQRESNFTYVSDTKKQAPKALVKLQRHKLIREVDRSGSKRDFNILMTLLMTVVRVSELLSLYRSDFEISDRKGSINIRSGKGNIERIITLNVEARRALVKYLEERSDTYLALFLSNRQERIIIRSVQHLMEKHGHNAHQMHHTFITELVRSKEDISIIQSLSGHNSADMILRYSMPSEEDKHRAVEHIFKDRTT